MILTGIGNKALYPDFVGRRALFVGFGNGPSSYTAGAGDPVTLNLPNYYIDALCGGVMSTDGTTYAMAGPSGSGVRQTWNLYYYVASSGAQASGNLSAKVFQIGAFVGQF
jgi:hypothetical protein